MPRIDVNNLAGEMLTAVKGVLQQHWKAVRPFAETEMQKLAITAAQIELGQLDGSITPAQAKILLRMQANATAAVFTAVETIGMIAAQDAINAALSIAGQAINRAIGIALF